jgi:diaminohydroxyphosphoribosylaminopyrimidine deaminase/5-amino-6-(5-phosphoribosylamino)uracil reductase
MFWTTVAAAASPRAESLRDLGAAVVGLAARSAGPGHPLRADLDVAEGLAHLRAGHGCHYVLCEGGGRLGLSLLERGLVGELHLHLSPRFLADNEAIPLFDGLSPERIDDGISMRILQTVMCGKDLIVSLRPLNADGVTGAAWGVAPL